MVHTTDYAPGGRGCGERNEGMPYACCGLGKWGKPVEEFIIDPIIPWPGKFQRGIKILPRNPKEPDGVKDMVVFVSKKDYPSPWDFIEEVAQFGASRKMSKDLPFEKLTPGPGGSRMVFCHAHSIPLFNYELNRDEVPLYGCSEFQFWADHREAYDGQPPERHIDQRLCTHGLKDLVYLVHGDISPSESDPEFYQVNMPSFNYSAKYPQLPATYIPTTWEIGLFLALPLTHFEFCRKADPETKTRAEAAGFDTAVLDY